MIAVLSIIQLLLAIVLVLLGVCGNLVVPFISYRTALRCPRITVLAALDFTASLLGPGFMLVTIVMGPTWLEHNKTLCQSLSFLSSWITITSFLVLFFFAVFCQKLRHEIYLDQRRQANRRELVFLAVCLLTGLLLGALPLLGWSVYNGLPILHSCISHNDVSTFSNYSIFYLACSFTILSITIFLAVRAMKRRRFYPLQLFWERHKFETKINDPEMTTTASSNTTSTKSYPSRRSSVASGRRSGVISACNSPMLTRKASQWQRSLRGASLLLEIIARERTLTTLDRQPGNVSEPSAAPEAPEHTTSSAASGMTEHEVPGEPFVISSRVPYRYPLLRKKKNIFEGPRCLPPFKGLQQQRSLSRLLCLRCCVIASCWLPLYVLLVLQICSVNYPQQAHVFITWLIFAQSSISSLLPLRDASYRLALRRAAYSCFKTCAAKNKKHVDLSKSCDVESRIEGSEQVRLRDVIPLDVQRL
ncbi:uncharacterized protein LOC144653250 [Oculina patagonica]